MTRRRARAILAAVAAGLCAAAAFLESPELALVSAAAGVAALAVDWTIGLAAVRADDRWRAGLCSECGYWLRGNVSGVCPECGTPARPPREGKIRG